MDIVNYLGPNSPLGPLKGGALFGFLCVLFYWFFDFLMRKL